AAEEVELLRQLGLEEPCGARARLLADLALEDVALDELVDPARARQDARRREHLGEPARVDVWRVVAEGGRAGAVVEHERGDRDRARGRKIEGVGRACR